MIVVPTVSIAKYEWLLVQRDLRFNTDFSGRITCSIDVIQVWNNHCTNKRPTTVDCRSLDPCTSIAEPPIDDTSRFNWNCSFVVLNMELYTPMVVSKYSYDSFTIECFWDAFTGIHPMLDLLLSPVYFGNCCRLCWKFSVSVQTNIGTGTTSTTVFLAPITLSCRTRGYRDVVQYSWWGQMSEKYGSIVQEQMAKGKYLCGI